MPAMATHYTSSALSVASTLHAEVFLVATAIETHFRLCLLSATSMPCMLRRHHTLQLYLVGNIRCSLVPFHSTIYKRCLNIIGCTVCVATAIYKRCLNISSVPCLPAPAPATALSEDRREGGSRTIPRRDEFQIICYFPAAATSRGQKTVTFNRKSSRVAWTTDTVWWCTGLYLRPQYVIKHQIHIWERWPFQLFESFLIICRLSSET